MAARSLSALPLPPHTSRCHCRRPNESSFQNPWNLYSDSLVTSFVGSKISIKPSNSRQYIFKRRSLIVATTSLSLPTAKPDRVDLEKSPKWSARAVKSIALGSAEARKLKHTKVGTESLLLGILVEGTSFAAKVLRENGITIITLRQEIVKLLGRSELCYIPPTEPSVTQQSQWALDWAVDEKLKSGETGEVTTNHLLLGIWSVKESAGHKLLAAFGFDDEKANELAKSINMDYNTSFKRIG